MAEIREGYFVREFETDTVICPAGNTLHRKCTKGNGYARYMCKAACSRCEFLGRCYTGKRKWKEIDFSEGAVYVMCRNWFQYTDICAEESVPEK